jgi:malonate transporter and related proteins
MEALVSIVLPVFVLIVIGYVAGRLGVFGEGGVDTLTKATFVIFMPPLLFRSMASVELEHLSWRPLVAYFSTALLFFAVGVAWQVRAGATASLGANRAISALFSNTVLLGIPIVQLAFGKQGLTILLMIVALHAVILLTLATVVIEFDLQRRHASGAFIAVIFQTLKSAIIHPVVLPIALGLLWGLTDIAMPEPIDRTLSFMGQAGPPASLVLLGASLVAYGIKSQLKFTLICAAVKLVLFPVAVYCVARFGLGLSDLMLSVVTITAALPTGANAYLLAQRYAQDSTEAVAVASATIALSTLLGVVTLSLVLPWLR